MGIAYKLCIVRQVPVRGGAQLLTVSPSSEGQVEHYYARGNRLAVLCVSKTVYAEAIEVFYETYSFWFCQAGCVAFFVKETLAKENGRALLNRVKNIRLDFELWHEDLEGMTFDGQYIIGWRDLFLDPKYRLPSLFPGLKHLSLEFCHSESRFRTKHTPTKCADQDNEMFFELWDWMAENPFRGISVEVTGLSQLENEWHMARDAMGLEYEEYVKPVCKTLEADVE